MFEELEAMKVAFTAQMKQSIEASEDRMTLVIKHHIGELLQTSENAIARIEAKASDVAEKILQLMKDNSPKPDHRIDTSSPARKQSRGYNHDVDMTADADTLTHAPITPATHSSPPFTGRDNVASERS